MMQYVSVTGSDHVEALKKLREYYGPDAIIYGEKWVEPKSIMSKMIGKKQFKIEAAIREKEPAAAPLLAKAQMNTTNQEQNSRSKPKTNLSLLSKKMSDLSEISQTIDQNQVFRQPPLEKEKNAMLDMVKKVRESKRLDAESSLEHLKSNEIEFLRNFIAEMAVPLDKGANLYPKEFKSLYNILKKQELSHQFIDSILQDVYNQLSKNNWKVFPVLYKKAADILCDKIKTSSVFHKRAVALVGTTGVGKTTTIAKIAVELKLKKNQRIAFITLDNYRIAATEQLKVYANILDVPIYICKNPKKMKHIFLEDKADVFLIDTAGLSHKNDEFLMRQADALNDLDYDIERHLVLAANNKPDDIKETVKAFSYLNFDRIIIGKIDETNRLGHLVEIAQNQGKAFSFFSTGQKVPDDYMPANNRYLVDHVLRGWK